jgi:hypothetical protein
MKIFRSFLPVSKQAVGTAIKREIGGQIPCGCQSIPKARRPSPEAQRLDSLSLLEPTKLANRTAGIRRVSLGVIDPLQIFDTRFGRHLYIRRQVIVALPEIGRSPRDHE